MSRPVAFVHGGFGRLGLVDMDTDLATHVHHHLHVVIKAGGADTRFRVRGRAHPVSDDHAVLVNAWEPHAWQRDPGAPPTLFLTLYLEPRWLRAAGFDASAGGANAFFPAPCVRLSAVARLLIGAVAEVIATRAPDRGEASVGAQIEELVPHLIDELRATAGRRAASAPAGGVSDYRIRRALALLHAPDGPAGIDAVARSVGLSRPRFFELFRQCTGLTPSRVVNAARMERAIGGLTAGTAPLGDLALDLGFATQGNFSRFFRQQIGVSPHAFRRAAIPAHGGRDGPANPYYRAPAPTL